MKGCNIFLADGFEDIEALATRDVLVRGGVDVRLVSISEDYEVTSSHGLTVMADIMLDGLLDEEMACGSGTDKSDILIFPGGMPGSRNLGECSPLIELMNRHYAAGGSVAAICAAPKFVLSQLAGVMTADFTCFDGCEDTLMEKGWTFLKKPAVVCGRIITGRGSGHSIDFGNAILERMTNRETAASVASKMTLPVE